MCGITGFWEIPETTEAVLRWQVKRMADTMLHRGPDDSGTWVDSEAGLALGFRRLSIIDLSPTGHQPMRSANGRFIIVFNGEIYNYRELRNELEQSGTRFRGTSDTEVILEGASQWGLERVIRRLWGMFAIALWDRQERVLLLGRDRLGKKPLYYSHVNGTFLFGSEIKALRAHPAFQSDIDRDVLAIYMRHGYIPAPYSIHKKVHKLPPGHYGLLLQGKQELKLEPYWDARRVVEQGLGTPLKLTEAEAIDQLDLLLRDAVARRMIADVPLGAFLSGGVDSSTVVALMQAQSSLPVRTFSIGFHIAGYNEAAWAKAVAQHLGTKHTELYVTPQETQAVIPRLPDLYDEPFADSSQIPTFLVSELARRHVTVSLSGDGGDEVFAGYNRYLWAESIWEHIRHLSAPTRRCLAAAIRRVSPKVWESIYNSFKWVVPASWRMRTAGDKAHKLAEIITAETSEELYHGLVSSWEAPNELVLGASGLPTRLLDQNLNECIPTYRERMMYLDLVSYLPDDILVKLDRASMGVGLEARCPLLDHRVVEWAWRLPLDFKMRKGQSKWLLRQVLYRYVPPALVERPKSGFAIPIGDWLRNPLRDWAEALLDAGRLQREGLLNAIPIRRVWTEHLNGRYNNQDKLWVILMFEAWYERWQHINVLN
jgi:asparagine synthase (glutamine-hydrolysing)